MKHDIKLRKIAAQIQGSMLSKSNTDLIISEKLSKEEIEYLPRYINRHISGQISITIKKIHRGRGNAWDCEIAYE